MPTPSFVFVLGWACALVGSVLSVPQLLHLVRARSSAGLSLVNWQLMLAANISWVVHGIVAGRPNVWFPNTALLVCTLLVLRMIRADRHLGVLQVSWLGILVGLACIGADLAWGAAAFGLAVMVPQGIGALAQLKDLLRSADLSGVSPGYLAFTTFMQFAWLSWGLLAHEQSIVVAAAMMGVLCVVNLVVFGLRRLGVIHGADAPASPDTPALVAETLGA